MNETRLNDNAGDLSAKSIEMEDPDWARREAVRPEGESPKAPPAIRMGTSTPIYGIPEWVAKLFKCDSDLIQRVELRFYNDQYAMAFSEVAQGGGDLASCEELESITETLALVRLEEESAEQGAS